MDAVGLVIKDINFGESSKILTVLTHEFGRVQIIANRVRTHRVGYMKGSQLFSYSWFSLYRNRRNVYRIRTLECKEAFGNMSESLEKLSYATYFADIAYHLTEENITDDEQLSLILNTFYLMNNDKVELKKLKPVYELRAMSISGFLPDLNSCGICGKENGLKYFKLSEGVVLCGECGKEKKDVIAVNDSILTVMRHICYSDSKKIFWFDVSEKVLEYVGEITERYVAVHIERVLRSLKYLKNVLSLG